MSRDQQSSPQTMPDSPGATFFQAVPTVEEVPRWYALSTLPRNEGSVARLLSMYGIEVFLPTSESLRIWKNRQRKTLQVPLFVGYVFVRILSTEKSRVLGVTGAIRLVGNSKGPISISSTEIEFLRSTYCMDNFEPYKELVVGQKVRVTRGVMQDIEGVLVRKDNGFRFVVTIQMINQHIAAVVDASDLRPVGC